MASVDDTATNKAFAEQQSADFPLLSEPGAGIDISALASAREGLSILVRCKRIQMFARRVAKSAVMIEFD